MSKSKALRLQEFGFSRAAIARDLGLTVHQVDRLTRGDQRKLREAQAALRREGHSLAAIQANFGREAR